jgi:TRAP-type C4-dicarboxylate transport system substrate-binding protein
MVPVPTHTLAAMANVPQYSIFEFPYLFTDWEEIYKVLDSDLAPGWAEILETYAGVYIFGGFVKGWLSIGTRQGPINTPADLAGQRVRTMATDMQMALISSLGASPTIIAYGETYTALQQGIVDGMLTATSLFQTDRFCEVIDHLAIIRATAHFHLPTVNKEWLDSLPEDLRVIFEECMNEYIQYGREQERLLNEAVMISLETEEGVAVRHYTDAELAPFRAAARQVWEAHSDRPGAGVLDSVLEFLGKDFESLFN